MTRKILEHVQSTIQCKTRGKRKEGVVSRKTWLLLSWRNENQDRPKMAPGVNNSGGHPLTYLPSGVSMSTALQRSPFSP